jgi:hypothetical protein
VSFMGPGSTDYARRSLRRPARPRARK